MSLQYDNASVQYDTNVYTYQGATGLTVTADDTVTPSDALSKTVSLPKASTAGLADAISKLLGLNKLDTQSISDLSHWLFTSGRSSTITPSDSQSKSVSVNKADTPSLSDAISKSVAMIATDTWIVTDSSYRTFVGGKADTVTESDSVVKNIGVKPIDNPSVTDAISKAVHAGFTEATINIVDTASGHPTLVKSDSVSLTDFTVVGKILSVLVNDTIGNVYQYDDPDIQYSQHVRYNNDALMDSVSLVASFFRTIADTVTITDTITNKTAGKTINDLLSVSDNVSLILSFTQRPELYAAIVLKSNVTSRNLQSVGSFANLKPVTTSI